MSGGFILYQTVLRRLTDKRSEQSRAEQQQQQQAVSSKQQAAGNWQQEASIKRLLKRQVSFILFDRLGRSFPLFLTRAAEP